MDVIASAMGFLPDFLPRSAKGELSFEGIAEIKKEFCPESSLAAATIGIVKPFPSPCILLQAEMAFKKDEAICASQLGFGFRDQPVPSLRAVHATVNTAAREAGLRFHRNWRIPARSVITTVFKQRGMAEADEDLSWWNASGGRRLDALPVRVKAKKNGESVQALVIPTDR